MPAANPNLTFRQDLTDFGMSIMQDHQQILDELAFFMPTVPTGTLAGRYAEFHKHQHFLKVKTARSVGGKTATARWNAKMVSFLLDNDALKIPIDTEIELPLASDGGSALERSKLMTLQSQAIVSLASTAHGLIQDGVTAHANYGDWTNAAVDPRAELHKAALVIYKQTGFYPNRIAMSPLMWYCFINNPKVKEYYNDMLPMLTPELVSNAIPGKPEIRVLMGAGLDGGFDEANVKLKPFIGEGAWVYYSSPIKSKDEPSFANVLSKDSDLFGGVYEYLSEDGVLRNLRMAWNTFPVIRSTQLCCRIGLKNAPVIA
ncbi:MAG: hypothetical protein PF904_10880 [Kiritimatiellae bacterium]|jgi:hypothetical protein|nr:hypothetical protein [Kiritimatiellia bacterium]